MERFWQVGYHGKIVAQLTHCQLWLNVPTLDVTGVYLFKDILQGRRPRHHLWTCQWPKQGKPPRDPCGGYGNRWEKLFLWHRINIHLKIRLMYDKPEAWHWVWCQQELVDRKVWIVVAKLSSTRQHTLTRNEILVSIAGHTLYEGSWSCVLGCSRNGIEWHDFGAWNFMMSNTSVLCAITK